MSVFNYEARLSFYPVPKIACTSLKKLFFFIENGFEFKSFTANGTPLFIHDFYPSHHFEHSRSLDRDGHFRLAVVRDPIDRIISCYRNRVLFFGELDSSQLSEEAKADGLRPTPSLSEFVENLEDYMKVSPSIFHHAAPMNFYLGNDPQWFSRIYNIRQIDQLTRDVVTYLGRKETVILGNENSSVPEISRSDLTVNEKAKLRQFYKLDYDLFGRYL